ncbi:MAG: LytTR family DNA-binding domain-containing protein [Bacillota bacterium]
MVAQVAQDLCARAVSVRHRRRGAQEGETVRFAVDKSEGAEQFSPALASFCREARCGEGGGLQVACLAGITAEGRIYLFAVREIIYCGRDGRRGFFKTEQGEFFSAFTLEKLAARLKPYGFFRSHRCYLVNLDWVEGVITMAPGTYDLVLRNKGESRIPLSRERARELRQMLLRGRFKF